MVKFRIPLLAGGALGIFALIAYAANAPTYKNPGGIDQDAQGVVLIDKDTGQPYNAGAGGGGGGAVTMADGASVTLGAKADAKSNATDTTAVTAMQVLKQISASLQAPPSQVMTVADGGNVTLGAKADAKSTATDTTPITAMQVWKQISASVQGSLTVGTHAVSQSGTWTVQPGNTANTTPWLVALQPTTAGGSSTYSGNVTTAGSGAGVGGVAVDASAGQMYGYAIYNGNSSVCYAGFYDQTQALTNLGTTVPKLSIGIPANGGANVSFPNGIPFATAITISATTTRAGSTACSTGLDFNVMWK